MCLEKCSYDPSVKGDKGLIQTSLSMHFLCARTKKSPLMESGDCSNAAQTRFEALHRAPGARLSTRDAGPGLLRPISLWRDTPPPTGGPGKGLTHGPRGSNSSEASFPCGGDARRGAQIELDIPQRGNARLKGRSDAPLRGAPSSAVWPELWSFEVIRGKKGDVCLLFIVIGLYWNRQGRRSGFTGVHCRPGTQSQHED